MKICNNRSNFEHISKNAVYHLFPVVWSEDDNMDDNRANAEESMIQHKDDDLQNAVDFSFNNPGIYLHKKQRTKSQTD